MSIGKDASYNLAAAVVPALFTLATVPFYLQAIGPERFGVLAICWTIVAALGFASLGMGPALSYRLAKGGEPVGSRSSLVWTALMLGLAASSVGAILVVAVGELYFRHFFRAGSELDAEIRQALPMLAALLPLAVIIGVLNGALQGMRSFAALSGISILNAALLAVIPLTVASLVSVRLNDLILATVAATAVVVVVELAVCAKLVPLRLPNRPKMPHMKALMGYGGWISVTAFIAPLVMLIDRFVIGALRGPASVAAYVLPYSLVQQLVLFPASLTSAVLPRLAPLPDHEVEQLQSSLLMWLNGLLTPLSIVAIALAAPFFRLWIGPTLAEAASPVAAILLVGGWAHGIGHIPATIVLGRSRPDLLTKLLLAYLAPYLLILYFATLHFGVVGAAAAWTVRAAFDPILFLYTRPRRSDMWSVATSAAMILSAMTVALAFAWTTPLYWGAMMLILAAACYQNRAVLKSSFEQFYRVAIRTS